MEKIKKFFNSLYFDFRLSLPLLYIGTRILMQSMEQQVYEVIYISIELTRPKIFKANRKTYEFTFRIYRRAIR